MVYWHEGFGYAVETSKAVHGHARARLRELADALGFGKGSYELRSSSRNGALGAISLHHEKVQVEVRSSAFGRWELLIRPRKRGRAIEDGLDHFKAMYLLDDVEALALHVRCAIAANDNTPEP